MALPALRPRPRLGARQLQGSTLVYDRDPTEIHRPLIDSGRYEFTFAPDAAWCRILEFYCPGCGTQIEAEYLPPGHPPTYDMQIDVDALRAQWAARPPGTVIPLGRDVTAEPLRVSGDLGEGA